MQIHSPAVGRDRLLTQAEARKHGALKYPTGATMHNTQSIEVDRHPCVMKTATQEGCKTCWATMQYAVGFSAMDASHAVLVHCPVSKEMAGFMQAWEQASPSKQDSTIQCQPKPPQKGSGSL